MRLATCGNQESGSVFCIILYGRICTTTEQEAGPLFLGPGVNHGSTLLEFVEK